MQDFYEILNEDSCLCKTCQQRLLPHFDKFEIEDINGLSIYEYDDNIKSLLYQFKGCYDIELAPIFLNRYKRELNLMYKDYVIVPVPSFKKDDEARGFNHVVEIYKIINLPILNIIDKTSNFKQAKNKRALRKDIGKFFRLNKHEMIMNKKVLIVDDVCTTGSTLKAIIRLVKTAKPKKIKILVMSRRVMH